MLAASSRPGELLRGSATVPDISRAKPVSCVERVVSQFEIQSAHSRAPGMRLVDPSLRGVWLPSQARCSISRIAPRPQPGRAQLCNRHDQRRGAGLLAQSANPLFQPCVRYNAEPYRVSRRLQTLRDWSDETFKQILPGASGTGSAVGPGPQGGHETQWAAIVSVSSKVGCSAETLRKWVRRAERDAGVRPGSRTPDQHP